MVKGVIYLTGGQAFLPRLAVSLWSLRQHYDGPVTLLYPEQESVGGLAPFLEDARLDVKASPVPLKEEYGRWRYYATKPTLYRYTPYDQSLFIDADTLIAGDLSPLWPERGEFVATRHGSWTSETPTVRERVEWYRPYRPDLVDFVLQNRVYGLNTGVYAFDREDPLMPIWEEMTLLIWNNGIADEVSMQILHPHHQVRILDDRYNCHPMWGEFKASPSIWHFYNERHMNLGAARAVWLPVYETVYRENIAKIQDWTPAEDPHLRDYERARKNPPRLHPKFQHLANPHE